MQCHFSYYFFSLTTDIDRASENPVVAMVLPKPGSHFDPGVRIQILPLWLSVNSISSPDNGFSEERRPMANVGVYPYIGTKGQFNFKGACVFC